MCGKSSHGLLGGIPEVGDFFPENGDEPDEVVACIRKFVDAYRERGEPTDAEQVAFAVGALWGDELHKTVGWFNMLKDGQRPPASAGSYTEIG